jgi:hypothetical protein
MALQSLPGGVLRLGPAIHSSPTSLGGFTALAANSAVMFIGRVVTADGGSHTIDTTGSSSLGWHSTTTTFANAGTSVSVGLATVDTSNGPPARAVNVANVITFDVKATFAGGGGGISSGWMTTVPTSGTKTIANGDLVAFAVQMTARGGTDSVGIDHLASAGSVTINRPAITSFSGSYSVRTGLPNLIITFSDGTLGWIEYSDIATAAAGRVWNSGSATKEYGQLYQLPFPMKVCGIYGFAAIGNDTDVVLYSDPLGTPVAQKTVSIDANTLATASAAFFEEYFPSPYTVAANQPIGAVLKPGASNITLDFKTLAAAGHRASDPWGTSGYGISRASGAFANANSSLDHYYVGLLVSAFDEGGPVAHSPIIVARGTPY